MDDRKTNRQLEAELEATLSRLEEAEETLRAIRNHEVDAIVVDGPEGQQVYTLQGAERPYRILIETMSEGALTVATDGTILYCNSRLSELMKMPLYKIIGAPFNNFVISRNEQSLETMLHVCGENSCRGEFFLKTADGGEVPVSISARSLMLNDVGAFCIVAADLTVQKRAQEALEEARSHLEERVANRTAELSMINAALQEEIAERKRTEIALRESEQRWVTTLSSIGDAVIATDTSGRIMFMNALAEALTGWTLHDASQKQVYKVFRIINMHTRREVENPVAKVLRDGVVVGLANDTILVRKDGTEVPIDDSGAPIKEANGRVMGVVLVFRDIAERKRAEETVQKAYDELELRVRERTIELQQAYDKLMAETKEKERLEAQLRQAQKMEALGTLAGGVAHDFNNMLAAIIGFSEIAAERIPAESGVQRHIKRILEAGLRGRDLVKQMLAFSRQTEQEKKPLLASSIVKESIKLLRASIPSTVSISFRAKSESGLSLGDPVQIQQVLMNLCTNAAYAMREKGGTLDIELSDHGVSTLSDDPHSIKPGLYVKLIVRDTGAGISPDIVDKIFDPFFTTKKLGEGTGLGLSVVHGIVKQHDGYITVESEPGRGSTFTVYFPKITAAPETDAIRDDAPPTGSERILFIDDEQALAEMGEDILAELGYKVTSQMSGREALSLFKLDPSRFDLVITDQTMPEMTGVELAKELLAVKADLPIILCTGFSHLVDADKARAAGIRAFAMKPLTKMEIARTIRNVLDG